MISETAAAVTAGATGLVFLAGGSMLSVLPAIDQSAAETIDFVRRRRSSFLIGTLLTITGAGLLLWPVAAVTTVEGNEVWPSLRLFAIATATFGASFFAVASVATAALAWDDRDRAPDAARLMHQIAHLAIWSVSAPIGAIVVASTTLAAHQADVAGPVLVGAAIVKVVTVAVEVAGIGRRTGWNAGGWARGTSGYATVLWYAVLLFDLGRG